MYRLLVSYTTLALASGILLCASIGCTSPLDSNAPRKEVPVTPAPKITPLSYEATFVTAYGTFSVKGLPVIKIDTSVTPMRFWFDIAMEAKDTAGKQPLLHGFRLRLDSATGDGMILPLVRRQVEIQADFGPAWGGLQTYWSDETTNTASIVIAEHPKEPGKPRTVTVTLYLFINRDDYFRPARQEQVLGSFTITL